MPNLSMALVDIEAFGFSFTSGPQAPLLRLHRHNEIEFGLCEHASVVASIGGNIHKFTPGQLIAFWANQPHGPLAVETGAYAHTIHIPLPFITKNNDIPIGIISSLLNGKVIIAPQSRDSIIPDLLLMKHWLTLLRKDTLETRRIVLLEITAQLMRLDSEGTHLTTGKFKKETYLSNNPASPQKRQHFIMITKLLSERSAEPWTISSIAAEIGLNASYAMRLFKEMSGVTILECLTQHRVASAQRMLLTTDMKILDIAFECGFNSPSSFYVMFARISGQEPSVYRKTAGSHAVT